MKGKKIFEQSVEVKERKRMDIDEKEMKINGITIFIWAAVDLDDEKVIATRVSFLWALPIFILTCLCLRFIGFWKK